MALENWFLTHPFGVGTKNLNVIYTGLTGGGILNIDGEPTWPTATDGTEARFVILSHTEASLWQLIASTHVDDPANGWKRPLDYEVTQNAKVWRKIPVFGAGGGGGGTIPATTDLLEGDGAGNAADSGITAAQVVQKQPLFPTPTNNFQIVACLQAAGLCTGGAEFAAGGPSSPTVTPFGTIASTTNLLEGDGSGNAIDSGLAAIDVCLKQPLYPTPTNASEIIQCLQAAGLCA